jgi:hypothetical protein
MNPKPHIDVDVATLPEDRAAQHEAFVDFFGQHLFWCRQQAFAFTKQAISSPELRQRLGRIPAEPYTRVSELPIPAQGTAEALAGASVDHFIQLLLALLTSGGSDLHLGDEHAIRYKLIMEIIKTDDWSSVLPEEVINRNGRKAFASYFGRWMNRYHASPNVA